MLPIIDKFGVGYIGCPFANGPVWHGIGAPPICPDPTVIYPYTVPLPPFPYQWG